MTILGPKTLEAIAPGVGLAAVAADVMPWLDRNDSRVRTVVVAVTLLFTWRYMWWRLTATLPDVSLSLE